MAKAKSADSGAEKVKPTVIDTPAKKNTVKSVYKGTLTFGFVTFPVRAYKASDEDKIERHIYHSADCLKRIKENTKVVCTGCNAEVDNKTTVKGVDINGKVVIVTDEQMKSCNASEESPKIAIKEFVPAETIPMVYYSSTEFLAPNDGGQEAFAYFLRTIAEMNVVAIGSIQVRGHEYEVAIRPSLINPNGMEISYLFAEYEVRNCDKWTKVDTKSEMVEMMKTLVEAAKKPTFTPAKYDGTLQRQREMIKTLAGGGTVDAPKADAPAAPSTDLMAAMKAMLAAAGK